MTNDIVQKIRHLNLHGLTGKITNIVGLVVEGFCPDASIGTLCDIVPLHGGTPVPAEVVGFRDSRGLLMPLGDLRGMGPGSLIKVRETSPSIKVGEALLGRVINAMGTPIDGGAEPLLTTDMYLYAQPPNPMQRETITDVLDVGIRTINGLLTCGAGQRVGIMAGSGVGKSVLLGQMAKHTRADVNVIALIGERGREVKEFIQRDLGAEGLARSVVITATSDQSPLLRMRGAYAATAIAEYFCQKGKSVLLLMDSITRFAMAMREIGLAIGEPPTTKGYTPSVFAALPRLMERAGNFTGQGSITGMYTVLVEGDDMNEPIADAARSILDGHIVLSRSIAAKNHWPAIDVLQSTSRVMRDVVSDDHLRHAGKLRSIMATYAEAEDLINIGAYAQGSNPGIDEAISMIDNIHSYLRQGMTEGADFFSSVNTLAALINHDTISTAKGS